MAQFTNQAQLSYNNTVTNSNMAYGELLDVLSATKTAVIDEYVRNYAVTYVISIVNTGNVAFTGLTVSDNLGAYDWNATTLYPLSYVTDSVRYYLNGDLQTPPSVTVGPPLQFTGITVPANGTTMIIYEANTNQYAPLGVADTIENTAHISGGGISTPIDITETIETKDTQELTITKSIHPVPVIENGEVTYTFIIQNAGNTAASAAENVAITDTFDPILSNISAEFEGTAWVEDTDYSYNSTTGVFTSVAGHITVPEATFDRDSGAGNWIINPGVSVLTVKGTI